MSDPIKYVAEGQKSARQVMPTDEAELRAALYPCPGDRWQEMCSVWLHIEEVTPIDVLARVYVGPCTIRPEEARETLRIPRSEFLSWINRQGMNYDGNELWVAVAGNVYKAPPFGERCLRKHAGQPDYSGPDFRVTQ